MQSCEKSNLKGNTFACANFTAPNKPYSLIGLSKNEGLIFSVQSTKQHQLDKLMARPKPTFSILGPDHLYSAIIIIDL